MVSSSAAVESQLMKKLMDDFRSDRLVLPSLPDVAIRVRKAVQDTAQSADQIAKIIQIDPALSARIIQISNGPLSRGVSNIDSCQIAITRLGFRVTQNLVMSFTFRNMFAAKHPVVKKKMELAWKHSAKVGSISCVLSRITRGLSPDQGLLAGLVHDIGVLPLLRYGDQFPELLEDPAMFDDMVQRLKGPIGKLVLTKWKFSEELIQIPENVNNWLRAKEGRADYLDVVIVSLAHSFFGSDQRYEGPPLPEMPAFNKLALSDLGPGASIEMLKEANGEINQVMRILS